MPTRADLPGAGPARLRPRRHRARSSTTSPTSASATSTARRCWPPRPGRPTATTWSTTGASTRSSAARRPGCGWSPRCARRGSAWSSTSCPTTWASPGREANPAWWDVLRRGPARRTPAGSTSTGHPRPAPAAGARRRARTPWTTSSSTATNCATTSTATRSPTAPATAPRGRCTNASTTAGLLAPRRRELTYRRFFAVSDLAAVRVEDPEVFAATHARGPALGGRRELDGIRVDHPDGLRDPAGYLARLRAAAPGRWLVVEKILEDGEELPTWPVDGTTGYDALAEVCGLFVDPSAEAAFTALDTALTGRATSWPELTHECKLAAATGLLAAELARLVRLAPHLPAAEAAAGAGRARRQPLRSTGATCPPGPATWRRPSRGRPAPPGPGRHSGPAHRAAARPRRRAGRAVPAVHRRGAWPRGWRTPPTTGGPASSRSTRSAAARSASASRRSEFHRGRRPPGRASAGRDDHPLHPRHQARRGRPRPARRARRRSRSAGPRRRAGGPPAPRCPTRPSPTCSGRPPSAPGRSPGSGCTRTPSRPPARPRRRPPGPIRIPRSRRPCTIWSTRCTTTRPCTPS